MGFSFTMGPFTQIEVCANSVESAIQAQSGGAFRVELCENLLEGGTTPSYSMIKLARERLSILLNVLVRPRPGDFLYSSLELELMLEDIRVCKELGADGVVIGVLKPDGTIDLQAMERLMKASEGLSVTFHRAIDMCKNPLEEVMKLQELGVNRVLTSGGANKAADGWEMIRDMVLATDFQPIIMPGSGVNEENIVELMEKTGAVEFHVSLRNPKASMMEFQKSGVQMGGAPGYNEFAISVTSAERVRNIVALVNPSNINHPIK